GWVVVALNACTVSIATSDVGNDFSKSYTASGSAQQFGFGTLGNTGASSTSIPIGCPPGRGLTPSVVLLYTSLSDNGVAGVGWELDLGRIGRNTKNGVNYAGTSFVVQADGGTSELAQWSGNEYRQAVDDGSMTRFVFMPGPNKVKSVWDQRMTKIRGR